MQAFLMVVQVLLSISLIALILLQHGKGADAGAAFGSGASSTVFGAKGSSSFLSRSTAILATLFFAVSLALTIMAYRASEQKGVVQKYTKPAVTKTVTEPKKATTDVPPVTPKSDVPAVKPGTEKTTNTTGKPVTKPAEKK